MQYHQDTAHEKISREKRIVALCRRYLKPLCYSFLLERMFGIDVAITVVRSILSMRACAMFMTDAELESRMSSERI